MCSLLLEDLRDLLSLMDRDRDRDRELERPLELVDSSWRLFVAPPLAAVAAEATCSVTESSISISPSSWPPLSWPDPDDTPSLLPPAAADEDFFANSSANSCM